MLKRKGQRVFTQENTGQRKPVLWHILRSGSSPTIQNHQGAIL